MSLIFLSSLRYYSHDCKEAYIQRDLVKINIMKSTNKKTFHFEKTKEK